MDLGAAIRAGCGGTIRERKICAAPLRFVAPHRVAYPLRFDPEAPTAPPAPARYTPLNRQPQVTTPRPRLVDCAPRGAGAAHTHLCPEQHHAPSGRLRQSHERPGLDLWPLPRLEARCAHPLAAPAALILRARSRRIIVQNTPLLDHLFFNEDAY